jgi:cell shape-determining protein MreC
MENIISHQEQLENKIAALELQNAQLKAQLAHEKKKHSQWKSLAMLFHDTIWKLMNQYVL